MEVHMKGEWRKVGKEWHREMEPGSDIACCGLPIPADARKPAPDLMGDPRSDCIKCRR